MRPSGAIEGLVGWPGRCRKCSIPSHLMQISFAQLDKHLADQPLRPLYTLHGDEPLLLQEAAAAVRAAARARGFAERRVFQVAGARYNWSAVLGALGSQSLFAERQLIEIQLPSGKPGVDGAKALQQIAEQLGSDRSGAAIGLVLLPRLDRATRATGWFGALEQAGATVPIDAVERAALPAWIAQRLARQQQRVAGGEAGQRTLQFFADRVEGNLLAAHQEVQKLALLHPPGELSFEQIEQAVLDVARFQVFKLPEVVLAGQAQRASRMLDGLAAEGAAPVQVHYALAEEIRLLKRVHDACRAGRPLPVALRENRIWGAREQLFERVLPRLSAAGLAQLLLAAHQTDGIVKGLQVPGWPQDAWAALHRLAMQACGACAAAPAVRRARPPAPAGTGRMTA